MKRFLVVGATGLQGGATVDALLAGGTGNGVRALTRNPSSPSSQKLASRGVEVVAGDLDDAASLARALDGVDGAYLVTNFRGGGATVESEERQGKAFVDACAAAQTPRLVFSSVGGADRNTGIPHFESKWRIEQHARARNVPLSVVRPAFFMENFDFPGALRAFFFGALRTVLHGTPRGRTPPKKLQLIAARDIGVFAAALLVADAPETVEIAGDELTSAELEQAWLDVRGERANALPMPRLLLKMMPKELGGMFLWFGDDGYRADVTALRARFPQLHSFRAWLAPRT